MIELLGVASLALVLGFILWFVLLLGALKLGALTMAAEEFRRCPKGAACIIALFWLAAAVYLILKGGAS